MVGKGSCAPIGNLYKYWVINATIAGIIDPETIHEYIILLMVTKR